MGFFVDDDGTMRFQNRLCVASMDESKEKILKEAFNTRYAVRLGGMNMYIGLMQYFWWYKHRDCRVHR